MRGGAAARTARSRNTPTRRWAGSDFLMAVLGDGGADRGIAVHRGRRAEDGIGLAIEEGRVFAEIVDGARADGDQGIGASPWRRAPAPRSRMSGLGISSAARCSPIPAPPRPSMHALAQHARSADPTTTARRVPRPRPARSAASRPARFGAIATVTRRHRTASRRRRDRAVCRQAAGRSCCLTHGGNRPRTGV